MSTPTDPLFSNQWYLSNPYANEYDLNVLAVWKDYTGAGVKVMVMDNGFDYTHPDLAANYDTDQDYDYGAGDDDAAPVTDDDNHGTAVAGIIGAALNGTGVVGVAYGSTLYGARIDFAVTADAWRTEYVTALADAVTKDVGVINMSFGATDHFSAYDGLGNLALQKAAIADAVASGRDGLGIVIVKSAGNARGDYVEVNHDAMDADTRQVVVAALDRSGYVTEYSTPGSPILVSAFGSPRAGQIYSTDRQGTAGYNDDADGDYTPSFNGTSAAAPMVSGVVALILEANADLGWRDVQSILAYSARHVGSGINGESLSGSERNLWGWNGATNWNGGGLHFSADYGYGLVDALAAVRLAESWTDQSTSANEQTASLDMTDATTAIDASDVSFTQTMTDAIVVERVVVSLDFASVYLSDLEVYLTGPDGKEIRIVGDQGGENDYDGVYTFESQAFRGSLSAGDWTVRVVDDYTGDTITVRDVDITLYGAAPKADDIYIFTNEFSDFTDTHSKALTDADGGIDLLNAAAVTAAMTVNLGKGTGKIDGVAITISGIENIYAGDGADTLLGNMKANDIDGARGNDKITGNKGADILTGGLGSDDFFYLLAADSTVGAGRDEIADFRSKTDDINLSAIDAQTGSGNQAFAFIGDDAFSRRAGQLHFLLKDNAGTGNDFTLVEGDIDGNGKADFQIELTGLINLAKGDFIL
ncbi:MAG: hypothetical protein RLZZ444_3878 [Pseudomonadota bacterium]|jgi:subtilisin-like proprotein convertase family protein